MSEPKVLRGKTRVLQFWDRPGSPPGNGYRDIEVVNADAYDALADKLKQAEAKITALEADLLKADDELISAEAERDDQVTEIQQLRERVRELEDSKPGFEGEANLILQQQCAEYEKALEDLLDSKPLELSLGESWNEPTRSLIDRAREVLAKWKGKK